MSRTFILLGSLALIFGCAGKSSSSSFGSSGIGKITKANISSGAKGLVRVTGGVSASSFGGPSAQSSLTDNALLQFKSNGDLSVVTFTALENNEAVTRTLPVLGIKPLTDTFIALKIEDFRTVVLNKSTGDAYDLALPIDDMRMHGTDLYYLLSGSYITGQLKRVDLTDTQLTTHLINDVNGTTSNTGVSPTAIGSQLNDPLNPFKYLAGDQYASLNLLDTSFLFANGFVAARGGGSFTVMLFKEGDAAYDCQISDGVFGSGPSTGGFFQAPDDSVYYVMWVTSTMVSGYQPGEYLFRRDFSRTSGCLTDTLITQLGGGSSHFEGLADFKYKVPYKLTDLTRYVLNPNGFLKTAPDGNGGLAMTWTNLDLSAVPSNGSADNRLVVVDGDYLYYLSGTKDIYYQSLQSGSSPTIFHSATDNVTAFDVVGGQLIFSTTVATYSVTSAGAQAVVISTGGSIADTARF